jgi:predicted dehydrogenase
MAHELTVYDPGHFHAALLLSRRNPRVSRTVHVYAPPGPDVAAFLALVEGFNARAEAPTDWLIEPHLGDDALEAMIAGRRGIVVLAGRNGPRLALMHRLHDAGFHVLADKPWLTDSRSLPHLDAVTAGLPLAIDIMTGRHGTLSRLRNAVIRTRSVFGDLDGGGKPALELFSRHHLLKRVSGRPLRRPAWYYDVGVQGDGMVDVQSHYVDQAQWIVGEHHRYDADRDVEILDAERWATAVPLALFRESTGEAGFPDYLAAVVEGDVLPLACNGRIDYRLCGVHVRQHCEWGLREPDGGGDIQGFTARGTNATLTVDEGPETGFAPEMLLDLREEAGFAEALDGWRADFPGLEATRTDRGHLLALPPAAHISHEAQFPRALDGFLDLVETGAPCPETAARIRTRYTLLARARDKAGTRPA